MDNHESGNSNERNKFRMIMMDIALRFNVTRGYLHLIRLPSVRVHSRPSQLVVTNAARRGGWIPR